MLRRALPSLLALLLRVAVAGADPEPGAPVAGADPEPPAPAWSRLYAPPTPPELDAQARDRIEAGHVLVASLPPSADTGLGVLLVGLVEAPPGPVWQVMADCEAQDEFLPRVLHAQVSDRAPDGHTCDLVLDLPFPLEDARTRSRHRVRRLPDGGYQRTWHLLPGDWSYERNSGSWSVHPYPDGRSLLVSRMDLLPKSALPLWVVRAAQSRQAPETFEAIRRRVRGLAAPPGEGLAR